MEARWAAWFDLVGITWTYEPFDAAGYIPDFLCRPNPNCPAFIVEVKGLPWDDPLLKAEAERAADRVRQTGRRFDLHAVGCDPDFKSFITLGDNGFCQASGWIGQGVFALFDSQEKYLAEAQSRGDTAAIAGCEYLFEATPSDVGTTFHLTFDIGEAGQLQMAWGQAHEIARWMPVAARP